jgi:hypothetical protein
MTPSGLLSRAISAKNADKFFISYREYMMTSSELSDKLYPIIVKVESKSFPAINALEEVRKVISAYLLVKPIKANKSKLNKAYIARIVNEFGQIQIEHDDELVKSFDLPQQAERWVNNRLFNGAPNWHGEVEWTKCPEKLPMRIRKIERNRALFDLLRTKSGALMHTNKVSSIGGLGFGVKVKNCVSYFSQG